jgi:PAS domain S-box-containing protein
MLGFRDRRRLRLQYRILVALIAIVTGVIALVIMVVDVRQRHVMMELNRERGLAIGHSLAAASSNALLSYNYVALQQLTQHAVREDGVRYVIVLDKEGKVAGYSGRAEWQGRELSDPVSRAASTSGDLLIQQVHTEEMGRHAGLDIAIPVFVEGSPTKWGLVRVGLSLDGMYEELNRTRAWLLALGAGVLFLGFMVARLLARRIVGPMDRLVEATTELAKGNFDYRVGLTTGDEIEDLSRKFDWMAREIREKQSQVESTNRELATLNANLEEKVVERTRALTEAEEKYRLLVEQSPNPICIIQDAHLVFFNQAFCEIFGYSTQELASSEFDLTALFDPEETGVLSLFSPRDDDHSGVLNTPREVKARRRDGTRIHLDMRSTVISFEGSPALEAILVDVTEQRELQDNIVSYERLRALGEMASGVAHDFNNVLGAILARAQFLHRHTEDEELLRGLRIIEKAAQDGAETVKRIQEFTRVRTDRDFAEVNLNDVLEDVLEMTRSRWVDEAHRVGKKVEVRRSLRDIQAVAGNISELREVFTNLILNAVDAIPREGIITVYTYNEGPTVRVIISDTGEGMSPEVQRRLFDPFFTTKGSRGNGLGMSIVYGIIRRHGGDITVKSELNQGTSFEITFPALAGTLAAPEADAAEVGSLTGSGRILVVDDEEDIRTLVAEILEDSGYHTMIARGGAEAIEMVQANPFDLVVTDLGMPVVSGWDVAREAHRVSPDVRLLLLTGWGSTLDPREVERNGIDRTLKKPFEMNVLLKAVHELLDGTEVRKIA